VIPPEGCAAILWRSADAAPQAAAAMKMTAAEQRELGVVDGVIDEESRNAIRDFQVTAGLEVNGQPSFALLDELRAAQAELSGN
jgi:acetyl-CoA carboxylase alpha subunit